MKMILQYLRTHRRSVVLFSVCAVILTALYILFDVEERLIAYGYVVCIAVGLALSVGVFATGTSTSGCSFWKRRRSIPSIICRRRRI